MQLHAIEMQLLQFFLHNIITNQLNLHSNSDIHTLDAYAIFYIGGI